MKRQRQRVRVKILCKAKGCNAEFNSDYRLQHNRKQHSGKSVPFEVVGSPSNPFDAAKRRNVCPNQDLLTRKDIDQHQKAPIPFVDESAKKMESCNPDDNSLSPSSDLELRDEIQISPRHQEHLAEARQDDDDLGKEESHAVFEASSTLEDTVPDRTCTALVSPILQSQPSELDNVHGETALSTESSDIEDEPDMLWVTCAGKLQHLMDYLDRRGHLILEEVRQPSVPDIEQFIVALIELTESMENQSNDLKKSAKRCLEELKKDKGYLADQPTAILMDHDPGKCEDILSENQREYLINMGPCQPKLASFPTNANIAPGKQNKFSSHWYKEYHHLEYSIDKDAAFCFVCRLFPEGVGRYSADKSWTVNGVKQWHKMKSVGTKKKGKLEQHFTSQGHKEALRNFAIFMNPNQQVDALLDSSRRQQLIREANDATLNTRVVSILGDIVRTLAMQDIAFRGETDESSNFYQIVQLVSRHCPLLEYWLNEKRMRPYHVTYLSTCSQNEFIKLIGDAVRKRVLKELEEAPAFSVMADTTPDTSNKDQMSTVVRYVANSRPVERLLSLTVLEDKTGDGHATEILRCLNKHSVDVAKLYFQSYDFTACMSGEYNGCHKKLNDKIQKDFPERQVPYIPCQAHRLNTFVERSCKASSIASSMFSILQLLYSFFSSSTKRTEALAKAQESIEGALKLRNLSQTRWIARSESIDSVWISFESIVALLTKIIDKELKSDKSTQDQAKSLLKKMKKYDFIFSLATMRFIMRHCKVLVVQLQDEGLNLLDALTLVSATTSALEKIRNTVDVDNQVRAASEMARQFGCDPHQEFTQHHRKRLLPMRFDERPENEAELTFASFYRREVFSILDQLIADCKENWNRVFENIKPFSILLPPWEKITEELAEGLCILLGGVITSGNLVAELSILREEKNEGIPLKSQSVQDVAAFISEKKLVYPTCNIAFTFLQTAPVTVASNERSFSKLKVVKNKLRSTMLQDRLESLMLISSERDLSEGLDLQAVIKNWIKLKKRRVLFS
jgi:hypothetical protein